MPIVVPFQPAPPGQTRLAYEPAEVGATVTQVRIYEDPARTGETFASGIPTLEGGVWTFGFVAPDGDYYTAWDVTDSTGSFTDAGDFFYVRNAEVSPGSTLVGVHEVRARLNKTAKTDDPELADMIAAAVAEYEERVGPVGTKTLRYDGGRELLILPLRSTVTAVRYADGTVVTDFTVDDAGLLRLDSGGYFPHGSRNVSVTFTASVPANHRETILADVAGLFAATQRGNSLGALPDVGYESGFVERTTPLVLFPRIRALAPPRVA